jgi:hypothetical protein
MVDMPDRRAQDRTNRLVRPLTANRPLARRWRAVWRFWWLPARTSPSARRWPGAAVGAPAALAATE